MAIKCAPGLTVLTFNAWHLTENYSFIFTPQKLCNTFWFGDNTVNNSPCHMANAMQVWYEPPYENRPISLYMTEYTRKMQQALSGQWIQLGNSTHRTKCCGKCLTCFWVTRVRRTAREAGTAGVSVWTAGTWGREARGATHIHRLALLCNKQNRSDDIQKGRPPC